MKIVATCRTYNEAEHIKKFCEAYSEFADEILVADGGSDDDTISIAYEYPKVSIRKFDKKVECPSGGMLRNPDGEHIQFLVDWAVQEGADWIVHQDCDQRPNKFLKEDIRDILSVTDKSLISVTQIFLWGEDRYFPQLSGGVNSWMQGLWAWRANLGMKIIDKMPHYEFSYDGHKSIDIQKEPGNINLMPPYCFMHYGWTSEEKTNAHVEYYRKSGLIPGALYPNQYGGRPEPLLDWMVEK